MLSVEMNQASCLFKKVFLTSATGFVIGPSTGYYNLSFVVAKPFAV